MGEHAAEGAREGHLLLTEGTHPRQYPLEGFFDRDHAGIVARGPGERLRDQRYPNEHVKGRIQSFSLDSFVADPRSCGGNLQIVPAQRHAQAHRSTVGCDRNKNHFPVEIARLEGSRRPRKSGATGRPS